ncbi:MULTISPECIES: hypothetical protein [Bacillaceae]|uniref:Uncharacterized protein n=1 Tax=Alkalicoccobacillus plakortidis TaxID=444060 RepID=A0A9D5DTT2_9BACI|nr:MULTISPECIES: hypothetical protein [Bacillaceae]KQL56986.1 hypothetical protein AN965_11030 [Alkalicoccobacillus plakortidis]
MKRYRWTLGVFASIFIILLGFVIPINHGASSDERVVVDYTLNLYSTPDCFDTAGFTNNIDEATYGDVEDHVRFLPESNCTALELKTTKGPLWYAWFL